MPKEKTLEDTWLEVFEKLQDERQIHKDDLEFALDLIGVAKPNSEWILEIFGAMTKFNQMRESDFLKFVHKYFERQHEEYEKAFRSVDVDQSGFVDVNEMEALLRSFGVEPMKYVLEEVIKEVDEDGTGSVDLAEFERVMEILASREGFTREEHVDFLSMYTRFDTDNSGEIDMKELLHILNWFGYSIDESCCKQIVDLVDVDHSGTMNQREYLICMRKVRDREVGLVKEALFAGDTDGSGTVSAKELQTVLEALGCVCDPVAVHDAVESAGLDPDDDELDLGELWRLLTVYRKREGLTTSEFNEVETAFKRYAKDGGGELNTLDVGKVLRWLGYPMDFGAQRWLVERVDVDRSGKLDLGELRKIIRMEREKALTAMHNIYDGHLRSREKQDGFKSNGISKSQVVRAIALMGMPGGLAVEPEFIPEDTHVYKAEDGTSHERVGYEGFLRIVGRAERVARMAFREGGGFTKAEVEDMRKQFQAFDEDGSGDISNRELIHVIECLFPTMANDQSMRPKLVQLLHEVDQDGNESLEFSDFVRMMRQFRDLEDLERARKEREAVEATSFSLQEVAEFRELFLASSKTMDLAITLDEVKEMIQQIVPLGDRNSNELAGIFRSVTCSEKIGTSDRSDVADFPEFIRLMQKLLESDFAGIRARTASS